MQAYGCPNVVQLKLWDAAEAAKGSPKMSAALVQNCAIEATVAAIDMNNSSDLVVYNGAYLIIRCMAMCPKGAERFASCGGLRALVGWLWGWVSDPTLRTSLSLLVRLAVSTEELQALFAASGGVDALVEVVRRETHVECLTEELQAILAVVNSSTSSAKLLAAHADMPRLFTSVLRYGLERADVAKIAAIISWKCMCADPKSFRRLCTNEYVSLCLRVIEAHPEDSLLARNYLINLGNLTECSVCSEMLRLAGGMPVLAQVLREYKAKAEEEEGGGDGSNAVLTVASALYALYSMVVTSLSWTHFVVTSGLFQDVVDIVLRHSTAASVLKNGFSILSNVISVGDYIGLLERDGGRASEPLVSLALHALDTFAGNEVFQNRTINLLSNMAVSTCICSAIIRESGHVALTAALRRNRGSLWVTMNCLRAIGNTSGDSEECTRSILSTGVLKDVHSILRERSLREGSKEEDEEEDEDEDEDTRKEFAERCLRTIELLLSYEAVHREFAYPELLRDASAAVARFPESVGLAKSCDAIHRRPSPEVAQAIASGMCTNVCTPACANMCPFKEGHYYCAKCCTPQLTYFCKTCNERHEKNDKFCVSCWNHHPHTHKFYVCFLSRRCHCEDYFCVSIRLTK